MERVYMCIDLKSFYASVECVDRNLDPLNTNLVVADSSRTDKTVCLAITPSLKAYGLGGRARLYEVKQKINKVNSFRNKKFKSKSYIDSELKKNKDLEVSFIIAPPRMKRYIEVSLEVYGVYLKYLSKDDIYVYSIDEVFCDITNYLEYYNMSAEELTSTIIKDVYKKTGITATAGIGPNLYLAKICMDIVAKHADADEYGVRIAHINVDEYRKKLWEHRPLSSFWGIGKNLEKKLNDNGMYCMGDIAKMSLENEDLLYNLFGVNAEIMIDHAWGYEQVKMEDIKAYTPKQSSISLGQVLHTPYSYDKAKIIIKEMSDTLSLELTRKNYSTKKIVLDISYDIDNIKNGYSGETTVDVYGRIVPKHAHGTVNLDYYSKSSVYITKKSLELFDNIIDKNLLIRKINICASNIISDINIKEEKVLYQLDLFSDNKKYEEEKRFKNKEKEDKKLQNTIIDIKNKYGKNSILKGINFLDGATQKERNEEVGGHKG